MIMTYKCPYTEVCRAETLREFARFPELALIVQERLQCSESDDGRARRCATRLGLTTLTLPTLGGYIQERRRTQHIPQQQLAQQVGVDVQLLRDLELNKTDPAKLPRSLLEQIASALSESVEYLVALTRKASSSNTPRLGAAFTRITPTDENQEPK
jgi:transcriptional regulator with XRE-family HTH domain